MSAVGLSEHAHYRSRGMPEPSALSDIGMQHSPLSGAWLRVLHWVASSTNDGDHKMKSFDTLAGVSRSLVAGVVAATIASAAPALAAPSFALPSFPFDVTSVPPQDLLLYGSIALLVIALTAKVIRDRHDREPPVQGPDLRWWKNPPPTPQP